MGKKPIGTDQREETENMKSISIKDYITFATHKEASRACEDAVRNKMEYMSISYLHTGMQQKEEENVS